MAKDFRGTYMECDGEDNHATRTRHLHVGRRLGLAHADQELRGDRLSRRRAARTTHKHGVEPSLNEAEREAVAKRFADSGSSRSAWARLANFILPIRRVLKKNIEETKAFIRLCHDFGGSGVKVRPNGLPKEVPVEKTLAQIGRRSTKWPTMAKAMASRSGSKSTAAGTADMPDVKTIMDAATTCEREDLLELQSRGPARPPGLKANFNSWPSGWARSTSTI